MTMTSIQSLTAETASASAIGTTRAKGIGNTTTASAARGASAVPREADVIRQPEASERALRAATPGATRVGVEAEAAMMIAVTHAVTEGRMETVIAAQPGRALGHARRMVAPAEGSTATAESGPIAMAERLAAAGTRIAAMLGGVTLTPPLPSLPRTNGTAVPSLCSSSPPVYVPGN